MGITINEKQALKTKKAGENLLFQISSSRTITPKCISVRLPLLLMSSKLS